MYDVALSCIVVLACLCHKRVVAYLLVCLFVFLWLVSDAAELPNET